MDNLDKILEGLLFLSGDGLDRGVIMEKLQVTPKQLDKAVEVLKQRYNDDCGINMITYKDKLQLCASPKYADDVSQVLNPIRERQLTRATLEVMAIIAYKQPVTRIDVQDIRGINSDYAIQTLLNYKLIEVVGRKDAVGKPLLFGTTDEFLRHFGLNSLDELPDYEVLMKSVEKIQLENNHLYNEFDIPNEEDPESEDELKNSNQTLEEIAEKIDDKNIEKEVKENTEKIITEKEVKEPEKPVEQVVDDDGEDMTLESMLENEHDFSKIMQKISKNNRHKKYEKHELELGDDNGGIDWTVINDNPDIDVD